jgi:hypothetical protein
MIEREQVMTSERLDRRDYNKLTGKETQRLIIAVKVTPIRSKIGAIFQSGRKRRL